jgi:hypothetical protein
MVAKNKKDKTDKKKHPGIGGDFLKSQGKSKRFAFFNSVNRRKNNKIDEDESY